MPKPSTLFTNRRLYLFLQITAKRRVRLVQEPRFDTHTRWPLQIVRAQRCPSTPGCIESNSANPPSRGDLPRQSGPSKATATPPLLASGRHSPPHSNSPATGRANCLAAAAPHLRAALHTLLRVLLLNLGHLALHLTGTCQGAVHLAAAEPQHQVQRALLLDVVVGQSAAILELLAREDQALQRHNTGRACERPNKKASGTRSVLPPNPSPTRIESSVTPAVAPPRPFPRCCPRPHAWRLRPAPCTPSARRPRLLACRPGAAAVPERIVRAAATTTPEVCSAQDAQVDHWEHTSPADRRGPLRNSRPAAAPAPEACTRPVPCPRRAPPACPPSRV